MVTKKPAATQCRLALSLDAPQGPDRQVCAVNGNDDGGSVVEAPLLVRANLVHEASLRIQEKLGDPAGKAVTHSPVPALEPELATPHAPKR